MGLETGTYISDLNALNPVTGDQLSQADDHLRRIKSFIKASFPNITGAMTATHTILNGLDGRVTTLEAQNVVLDTGDTITGAWDASGATWSNLGAVTTADINGGSIDGAVIGAASAAAGTFAALVGTTFNATGAATFGSTVLLNADPTLDLQAATKQYVDNAPAVVEFISGLTLSNNATDASNDLDVTAGAASDGTMAKVMSLAAGLTKQIDAAWAVGTNAGMMDTGTVAADTWYHVFLIMRSDTGVVDMLCSLSPTAPTMPTNYDYKRCIGRILFETAAIRPFIQTFDKFAWKTRDLSITARPLGVTTALTGQLLTPSGVEVEAEVTGTVLLTGGGTALLISSTEHSDVAATESNANVYVRISYGDASTITVKTDTNRTIRYRGDAVGMNVNIITAGWIDPRGRIT